MSVPILVRPATAADLAALIEIEQASFADPWGAGALAAELALSGARLDVAVEPAGAIVGYAAWRLLPGEAELLKIAVRPDVRRRGIATALAGRGFDALRAAAASGVWLEVRENNLAAIALYERLGFAIVGRRPGYYSDGTAALLLRREL